jgi:hypothetical protein
VRVKCKNEVFLRSDTNPRTTIHPNNPELSRARANGGDVLFSKIVAEGGEFQLGLVQGSIAKHTDTFPLFFSVDMMFPPFGERALLGERVRSLFRSMLQVTWSGALCWPRLDDAGDTTASRLSEAEIERTQVKPKFNLRQSQSRSPQPFSSAGAL